MRGALDTLNLPDTGVDKEIYRRAKPETLYQFSELNLKQKICKVFSCLRRLGYKLVRFMPQEHFTQDGSSLLSDHAKTLLLCKSRQLNARVKQG
jgi:hypothetical protein